MHGLADEFRRLNDEVELPPQRLVRELAALEQRALSTLPAPEREAYCVRKLAALERVARAGRPARGFAPHTAPFAAERAVNAAEGAALLLRVQRFLAGGADPSRLTMSSDGGGCLPTFDSDGNLLAMDVGTSATLLPAVAGAIRSGVPIPVALGTVTANPAAQLRLHSKGRVRAGFDADLAVVGPELDVRDVLAGGRWLVRDGRPVRA